MAFKKAVLKKWSWSCNLVVLLHHWLGLVLGWIRVNGNTFKNVFGQTSIRTRY